MTSSVFFRRLSICLSMTTALIFIFSLSLFFWSPSFTWSSVQSDVRIVTSAEEIKIIRFAWWACFALSAMYIILSFFLGEEGRDALKLVVEQFKKEREAPHMRKLILPLL